MADQDSRIPSLEGKVALVTGASRGVGRAIAQRLGAAGATVVVAARSLDTISKDSVIKGKGDEWLPAFGTLAETVELIEQAGGRAIPIACDLTNPEERAGLIDKVVTLAGRLDILVNNAGQAATSHIEHMTDAQYQQILDIFFTTPFVLSRAAIPVMRAQGQGWILNIGSAAAQKPVRPYMEMEKKSGMMLYAAVKSALQRFTQGLALEVEDYNIAVNQVAPSGAIVTPGSTNKIPEGLEVEPIEYISAVALDLVHRPAREQTGIVAHSMHYAKHYDIPVTGLDGKGRMPPAQIPAWNHPDIIPSGL